MNYRETVRELMPLVKEAFKNLRIYQEQQKVRLELRTGYGPQVGDVYIFSPAEKDDMMLFWIIVNQVDNDLFTVIPLDDFPFLGSCDISIELLDLKARCGRGLFLSGEYLKTQTLIDFVPDQVPPIKRELAALARGQTVSTEEQTCTNADPEYEEWMDALYYTIECVHLRDSLVHYRKEATRCLENSRFAPSVEYASWVAASDYNFQKAYALEAILNKK